MATIGTGPNWGGQVVVPCISDAAKITNQAKNCGGVAAARDQVVKTTARDKALRKASKIAVQTSMLKALAATPKAKRG